MIITAATYINDDMIKISSFEASTTTSKEGEIRKEQSIHNSAYRSLMGAQHRKRRPRLEVSRINFIINKKDNSV